MVRTTLFAASVLLLAGAAHAQTSPTTPPTMPAMPGATSPGGQNDMMHMMALGGHNQLGVLEYCQGKGYIGADTVALQTKMLTLLPKTTPDGLTEAEATGKTGVVAFGGAQTSLDDAATKQGTTVDALCKKLEAGLQQAAKSMPQ